MDIIDPNKVIQVLANRISELEIENAKLIVALNTAKEERE